MKLTLNTKKHSFYSIEGLVFTIEDPGPKSIEFSQLTASELNQIVYGIRIGALLSDTQLL